MKSTPDSTWNAISEWDPVSHLDEWAVAAGEVSRDPLPDRVNTGFAPSCLLLPGWLEAVTREFENRPVVFIPDRDRLLVLDGDMSMLEAAFADVLHLYRESEHPVSPQGYTLDDAGQLSPCDLVDGLPVHAAFIAHEALFTDSCDGQTRQLLDAWGGWVPWTSPTWNRVEFAGSFALASLWEADPDLGLVELDIVSIYDGPHKRMLVPFQAAVSLAGLTPMPDTRPLMYRVRGLPALTAMVKLRAVDEMFRRFLADATRVSPSQQVAVRREIRLLGGRIAGTPAADVLDVLPREFARIMELAVTGQPEVDDSTAELVELANLPAESIVTMLDFLIGRVTVLSETSRQEVITSLVEMSRRGSGRW